MSWACEVLIKNGYNINKIEALNSLSSYNYYNRTLTPEICDFLGLQNQKIFMRFNDQEGMDFKEIADKIINEWETFFSHEKPKESK